MKEEEQLMKGSVHEDDLFIVHDALVLMTAKETIKWTKENNYFHRWFLPMNGLQDRTPYAGRPVGNSPKFMPLYNSLNRDILQSLRFHCVLRLFLLDGEGTDEEERNMRFSPLAIYFGVDKLKRIFLSSLSKFCCITYLIWFMMKEAEKLMKGSVHEDDFFIIHDALVLITAKETIIRMKYNN